MIEQYDDIVVGAGFAGIFTATYLASKGEKVILIEKNQKCGGLFQTINLLGDKCFLGPHHIGGLCKGNYIDHLFQSIGINMDEYFIQTKKFGVLMNGKKYEIPLDLDEMSQYIKSNYPSEKKVDDFIEEIKVFQTYFNENNEKGQLKMFMKTSRISYKDYLRQYFDNLELIQLLCFLGPGYGAVSIHDSAFSNISLLVTYSIGAYYIKEGDKNLIDHMLDVFRQYGGKLLNGIEIIDVIEEDNKLKGVICNVSNGEKEFNIYGNNIIFASNPFPILQNKFHGLRTYSKAEKLSIGPSVTRIFCTLSSYSEHLTDLTYMGDYDLDEMGEHIFLDDNSSTLPMCMICFPNQVIGSSQTEQKICMFTFLTYEIDCKSSIDKERVIQMIKEKIPEIGKNIIDTKIVDFNLYKKLSNTKTGSVFGWKRNVEAVMATNTFAPVFQGIDGMYLVGNWSTDFGIYGCIRSSKKASDLILSNR